MKIKFALLLLVVSSVVSASPKKTPPAVKIKKIPQKMSFNSQVVEGEIYRPDYSVVTGDSPGEGWGVLRLRSNFKDHRVSDSEEAIK